MMIDREALLKKARQARDKAYAPYSGFRVGAALLGKDGTVWLGCNVENAAFGCTICAERTALVKAVSEGVREFRSIAIVGSAAGPAEPCGQCRQMLVEFNPDLEVVLEDEAGQPVARKLSDMLPWYFSPARLAGTDDGGKQLK